MKLKNNLENNCFLTFTKKNVLDKSNLINIIKNETKYTIDQLNAFNFMKQKNKFYIQDYFDENGAKNFLVSKINALMEINLNDEVSEDRYICNVNTVDNKCEQKIEEKKKNNKNDKQILKLKVSSPKKVKKNNKDSIQKIKTASTPNIKSNKKITKIKNLHASKEKNKINNLNNDVNNSNKSIDDTNNSNYIYKIIIDNANESDDKLYKKLTKKIKKKESKKSNQKKQRLNNNNILENINNVNCITPKAYKNKYLNPFNFSQKAKDLMINEKIELSSIDNNNFDEAITICNSKKREKNKKDLNEKDINNADTLSNKESLLVILSDLM
jgi:hypothetical protein